MPNLGSNTRIFCSLGVEPVDKDVLKQKPRNTKEPMITRHLIVNVLLSALIIILGTLWVYNREVRQCLSIGMHDVSNLFPLIR